MLASEVREILRELSEELGGREVSIIAADVGPNESTAEHRALGSGRYLIARAASGADDEAPPQPEDAVALALEQASRALRSAARRWDHDALPLQSWPEGGEVPSRGRVIARIQAYLCGLAGSSRARNAIVTEHGEIVTAANDALELDSERLPFALKRVEANAATRDGTSFGEIVGDDFYARSFWHGAGLVLFFDGPWAPDFVRHRCRQVCRELGHLLASLDPPPAAPASIAPVPE